MKNLFLMLIITTVIFLQFTSCINKEKPCSHPTETVNIPEDDKKTIPYKDFTKLSFIRMSTGDTHTFIGQGYVIDYGTLVPHPDEGCPLTYKLQRQYQIFKSITFPSSIIISLLFYDEIGDDLEISFNNTIYVASPPGLTYHFDYDSLQIQGKYYCCIRYFKNELNPERNSKYGCYYNIAQGIIKMETKDGDKWELLKTD